MACDFFWVMRLLLKVVLLRAFSNARESEELSRNNRLVNRTFSAWLGIDKRRIESAGKPRHHPL